MLCILVGLLGEPNHQQAPCPPPTFTWRGMAGGETREGRCRRGIDHTRSSMVMCNLVLSCLMLRWLCCVAGHRVQDLFSSHRYIAAGEVSSSLPCFSGLGWNTTLALRVTGLWT